jgi:hypothetical protein
VARLGRKGRMLKWAGLVVSLLIVVAWVVSLRWDVFYLEREPGAWDVRAQRTVYAAYGRGCFAYYQGPYRPAKPDAHWGYIGYSSGPIWTPILHHGAGSTWWVVVPLWMPFVLIAISTVYLWWRDRRRIRPGHCQECGYNLTGNVSGVCPECGERISGAGEPAPGSRRPAGTEND